MNLLRNIISQLHKSLQKNETASNNETSSSIKNISLKKPVEITDNILQSNGDVEVSVTRTNECDDKKIAKNLSKDGLTDAVNTKPKTNNKKTVLNVDKSETCNKNAPDFVLLEKILKNTGVSITKANCKDKTVDLENKNRIQHKRLNKQHQDINSIVTEDSTVLTFDSETGNKNQNDTINNTPKELIQGTAKDQDLKVTTASSFASKNPTDNSKIQYHTLKCLQEFDGILAEVQKKDSSNIDDKKDLSLHEIDEILNEELEDVNSSYNFQEIKNTNIDLNGFVIANNFSDIIIGQILETVIERLHNEASKSVKDIDIISLNSNDSRNTDEVNTHIETNQTKIIKNELEERALEEIDVISVSSDDDNILDGLTNVNIITENDGEETTLLNIPKITQNIDISLKENQSEFSEETQILDTISINSDTEDDCGYNSSDFEVISEEEAKMDGFIVNFNPERHNFVDKKHISDKKDTKYKVPNDQHGPGPSSRNVERFNKYKRHTEFTVDKTYMENCAVPEENAFLNMFHGTIPGMPASEIHFLENKSVRTRAPMLVQYEGVGFDMNLAMHRTDSSNDEYREEAEQSLNKILDMYPTENNMRKRKRRF